MLVPTMATPPIVESFRALQTTAARHAVIAALADEFSSYDWRQIKALADAKSLQFDIIGNLPAELVFHVFSFLDVSTPFRLQTVSHAVGLLMIPVYLRRLFGQNRITYLHLCLHLNASRGPAIVPSYRFGPQPKAHHILTVFVGLSALV